MADDFQQIQARTKLSDYFQIVWMSIKVVKLVLLQCFFEKILNINKNIVSFSVLTVTFKVIGWQHMSWL